MTPARYAHTHEGRLLLMLRPGPVESGALLIRMGVEKMPKHVTTAVYRGLVQRVAVEHGAIYSLTEAGRAKCPTRAIAATWEPSDNEQREDETA